MEHLCASQLRRLLMSLSNLPDRLEQLDLLERPDQVALDRPDPREQLQQSPVLLGRKDKALLDLLAPPHLLLDRPVLPDRKALHRQFRGLLVLPDLAQPVQLDLSAADLFIRALLRQLPVSRHLETTQVTLIRSQALAATCLSGTVLLGSITGIRVY